MKDLAPAPARGGLAGFSIALTLGMGVSTFLAFALGTLAPFITEDLGLSRSRLGALTTAMFAVGAAGSPIAGRAVDSFGGRRVLMILLATAAAGLAASAAAPGFALLLPAVAIGGIALACGNPSTNKLVGAHAPPGRRGVVMGIKQSGVQVGGFIAGTALPAIAAAAGWRVAVLASTALPVAGFVALRLFVPRDPRPVARDENAPPVWPAIKWLAAYAFLMGLSVAVIGAYLTLYTHEEIGYSKTLAGFVTAVMAAVGVGARILWGRVADLLKRTSILLAVLAAFAVGSHVLVWAAQDISWLVWLGAIGTGASSGAWNAVGMLSIVRTLDDSDAGRGSGFVLLAFYGGYVVSPILFGWSLDMTGSYDLGWAAVTACYAGAAVVAAVRYSRERWGGMPSAD